MRSAIRTIRRAQAGAARIAPPVYLYDGETVIAVGDSITNGALDVDPYIELVATEWQATLDNRAISGSTLQNGNEATGTPRAFNLMDAFEVRTITPAAKAIVCAYTLNDARYTANDGAANGYPYTLNPDLCRAALRSCVRRWLGKYAREDIWLVTAHWISDAGLLSGGAGFTGQSRAGYEAYVSACRQVATEFGVKLVDSYAHRTPATTLDNIHPDEASRDRLAALFRWPFNPRIQPSVGAITGGALSIEVGAGLEAWLIDGATETELSPGANPVAAGPCKVVWREPGHRWELAELVVDGPATELELDSAPASAVGFTASDATPNGIALTGATTRNHMTWNAAAWPVGTRIQCTLTASGLRIIMRLNGDDDLGASAPNQNLYDATVSGSAAVDVTTNKLADRFGFLTIAAGDLTVSDFVVTFP